MKFRWIVPAILFLTPATPARAQFAIDLMVGPNWTSLSNPPLNLGTSSDIGYFLGGQIRFGHLLYVAPGLFYQYQSFKIENATTSDNVGISSFQIPVEVGVNLNAKVVAIQLGVAPTVTFNTSVNNNDWGVDKEMTNNTRWGYMLSGSARILAFVLNLDYQADFTEAFKGGQTVDGQPAGDGNLGQFRVGLGIGF